LILLLSSITYYTIFLVSCQQNKYFKGILRYENNVRY
jgi:hypothetical protein